MPGSAVQEIIADVNAACRDLRAAATAPGATMPAGTWSVAEVLGHIAFWLEAVVPVATYMLRGQEIPPGNYFASGYIPGDTWPNEDVHNAREAAWAAAQPFEAVIERFERAQQLVISTLATTITDADIESNIGYYHSVAGHIRSHIVELSTATP